MPCAKQHLLVSRVATLSQVFRHMLRLLLPLGEQSCRAQKPTLPSEMLGMIPLTCYQCQWYHSALLCSRTTWLLFFFFLLPPRPSYSCENFHHTDPRNRWLSSGCWVHISVSPANLSDGTKNLSTVLAHVVTSHPQVMLLVSYIASHSSEILTAVNKIHTVLLFPYEDGEVLRNLHSPIPSELLEWTICGPPDVSCKSQSSSPLATLAGEDDS